MVLQLGLEAGKVEGLVAPDPDVEPVLQLSTTT
jgi:hypothetical protein